uniref:Uncharacterized protein n=1 Tax=Fagus sylvatica TaxID=28930 RepID=A0A2N9F8U8_FAGSY
MGFTASSKLETSKLTFSDHLREIDHALGLEPGELLDTLELPNEDVSFQNSIGGVGKMDSDMAVPTSTFLFRPNSIGPRLDPTFVVPAKSKKPSEGTWKRLTRGPLGFKDHDPYPQQLKRAQADLLALEPAKSFKKFKNTGDVSLSNAMKISAAVVEQPRRTP